MDSVPFVSPYTPNTEADRRRMLDAIGVESVDCLFEDIPADYRNPSLDIPPPLSELELRREIEAKDDPALLHDAPHDSSNTRLDEARAARQPHLRWEPTE